jgi:hypothetical protein
MVFLRELNSLKNAVLYLIDNCLLPQRLSCATCDGQMTVRSRKEPVYQCSTPSCPTPRRRVSSAILLKHIGSNCIAEANMVVFARLFWWFCKDKSATCAYREGGVDSQDFPFGLKLAHKIYR